MGGLSAARPKGEAGGPGTADYQVTGDVDCLAFVGAELLIETARFWPGQRPGLRGRTPMRGPRRSNPTISTGRPGPPPGRFT